MARPLRHKFVVSNVATRAKLRRIAKEQGREAAIEIIEDGLKQANRSETPYKSGRMQRRFTIRRVSLFTYMLIWRTSYAVYVEGRTPFVDRFDRVAQSNIRARV